MRPRLLALSALTVAVVMAVPSFAAGQPKPQIVDTVGDANTLNSQVPGFGPGVPDTSTAPADVAAADIVSVTFANLFATKVVKHKKVSVPNGFTVTMLLSAAPAAGFVYRVSAASPGCTSVFFEYDVPVTGASTQQVRCPATPPAADTTYVSTAKVSGNSIVWTIPNRAFPAGSTLTSLNAQTRSLITTPAISVTAPQWDYAASNATFTIGK